MGAPPSCFPGDRAVAGAWGAPPRPSRCCSGRRNVSAPQAISGSGQFSISTTGPPATARDVSFRVTPERPSLRAPAISAAVVAAATR
jgi:hypothetical protein